MSGRRGVAVLVAAIALSLPAAAHAATPVTGGGSFNTAPLLRAGDYTDTVAAGETVYWKVNLAKGQVLRVKATVDTSAIETDPTASDYQRGLNYLDYRLDIFSPLREQLSEESGGTYDTATAELKGATDAGAKEGTAFGPRALGFEQILASDYDKDKFPAPGEWYVSLSAADSDFAPAEISVQLPVALNIQVQGAPEPSSADFARSLPGPAKNQPTPPAQGQAADLADVIATANEPADPALTIALVAAIALVGGLLLGALAVFVLGRRQT